MDQSMLFKRMAAVLVILVIGAVVGGGIVYAVVRDDASASESREVMMNAPSSSLWTHLLGPVEKMLGDLDQEAQAGKDQHMGQALSEDVEWHAWLRPLQHKLEKLQEMRSAGFSIKLPFGLQLSLPPMETDAP